MKIIKLTRLPIVLTALTLLAGLILASTKAKADDSIVSNVSITVPVSCNLNSTVDTPHTATINPGTMQENIGTTTFKVFCNDNNGFSVYANGYSGEENGNTKMLATVNNVLSPTDDIITGTATSGDTSNWAMKLTKVAGLYEPTILSDTNGSYEAYHTVPTDWTKIATLPGNTDFTSGSSFQTTYRAYISRTQPAGTYQGKVKYMMVHPASAAVPINFNDAYAAAGKTKLNGYYQMQDMDANICDAVNIFDEASQTQLIDARDNKLYYVAKLKDGECWMTQNLDHDINTSFAYTPDNTDIPANWTPDKSTYATSTTTWDTSSTGYNIQQSYDPGDKIWDGNPSSNTDITINNMTQGTNQHYHLGNYYNWGAAVAMNNTSSYTTQNQDVNQSICPKGWMLPKSGATNTSAGSFQYLVNQYNWASNSMTNPNMWASPLYFPLAGRWVGSSYYVAYGGSFWSSVVDSSSSAYYVYEYYSGAVTPATNYYRHYGFSVRCVAREAGSTPGMPGPTSLLDMTTMQEMTSELCAASSVGDEKQLRDTRDNKTYWVAKLQDGKCWMTQNLDHDIVTTAGYYTHNNTDLGWGSDTATTSWTPTRATIDASNVTNNSISGWSDDYNTPYSVDPGNWYWNALPFHSSTTNNFLANSGGTKWQKNTAYVNNGEHGHVGNYYNWSAAVASNSTSGYTSSTLSNIANNPQNSICPAGWRLPTVTSASPTYTTAGSQDEFSRLANLYANYTGSTSLSSENLEKAPLYLVRGGYVYSGQQYNAGYNGRYWSSSVGSSSSAYSLYFSSSYVGPQDGNNRYGGFSVRCVAR